MMALLAIEMMREMMKLENVKLNGIQAETSSRSVEGSLSCIAVARAGALTTSGVVHVMQLRMSILCHSVSAVTIILHGRKKREPVRVLLYLMYSILGKYLLTCFWVFASIMRQESDWWREKMGEV